MFDAELIASIATVADELGFDRHALAAIAQVESGGRVLAKVEDRTEPLIRFEGHYFYRLLGTLKRNRAVASGLAHPIAGRVRNPSSQTARWALLARACEIDRPVALCSCSWGVGQVMGIHWRWLDFASIDAFVAQARSGPAGQVAIMARFIRAAGLAPLIEARDWAGFARAYNGPGYRAGRYDEKIAAAFRRLGGEGAVAGRHELKLLRFGDRGQAVEHLQRDLRLLGHALIADGDFGRATQAAVKAFQASEGIDPDGAFGPETLAAMARRLPPAAI